MIEYLSSILKKIDQHGKSFNFNIEGEDHKTSIGGIITLLGFGVILYFAFYFGSDIVERKKPSSFKTLDKNSSFPMYNNSEYGVTLSVLMEDYWGKEISSTRFFEFEFILWEKNYDEIYGEFSANQTRITEYNVSNCKHSLLPGYPNTTTIPTQNLKCPDNFNFTFGGYWTSQKIILPVFIIKKCDNESMIKKNITCASEEEFMQLNANGLFFSFMIHQNLINMRNYEQPIKPTYYYQTQGVDLTQLDKVRTYSIKYTSSILNTDSDLFFQSDGYNQTFLEFWSLETYDITYNEDIYKNSIAVVHLCTTNDYNYYERSYVKIPDIIANIGGFFGIIDSIFSFILEFYVNNDFTFSLISKILRLETDDVERKIKKTNNLEERKSDDYESVKNTKDKEIHFINQIKNMDSASESRLKQLNLNHIEEPETSKTDETLNHLNKDLYKLIKYRNLERKVHEIKECDYSEYMFLSLCKSDKSISTLPSIQQIKYSLLKSSEKYIEKVSDIVTYFKNLEQLEVIKKLFLNEYQCFMLENIGKKLITEESSMETIENLGDSITQKRHSELIEYLSKSFLTDRSNIIDIYLYSYLDKELKESFRSIRELKPQINFTK